MELFDFAESLGMELSEGLIQNQHPMTMEAAAEMEPIWALRWRMRVCRISGKIFDITQEGLFYTSGEYVEELL
jgi:hypothetical protein|tara:strand:- start:1550 stop:1768 length:219 start_codon:yes stop_codon:yes gene_type:complete